MVLALVCSVRNAICGARVIRAHTHRRRKLFHPSLVVMASANWHLRSLWLSPLFLGGAPRTKSNGLK